MTVLQPTRFEILMFVSALEEVYFSSLTRLVHRSKSAVSQHVTILENYGLLERQPVTKRHKSSDPKTKICSTAKGRALLTYYFGFDYERFKRIANDANARLAEQTNLYVNRYL